MSIKFYEIDAVYVDYLLTYETGLYHNKQIHQINERKYIGIVLTINDSDYFAPLSSFKDKHAKMSEMLDFIKVGDYAVINLNKMFPVPACCRKYVDFNNVSDEKYKKLLESEYRIIRGRQDKIIKNAKNVYKHKIQNGNTTPLSKRCNDFLLLEEKAKLYIQSVLSKEQDNK